MKKKKQCHLPIEDVYNEYGHEYGTELLFVDPNVKFKVPPSRIEVIGEYEYYFLVRAYFGDGSWGNRERSYVTTVDKFDVYNENVYICRNYREESLYV